jgi:UDP-glucuronate 4-epimerase
VFASSSSVYGNNKKVPFSETDFVDHPISPYAATKRAGELICYTYHHLYGMDIACLRFFTVYGPRQRPDLAIHKFTKLLINGEEIPFYGDGTTERDYTFIDDIIEGVVKALQWVQAGQGLYEIFNLGESRTVNLKEMVTTLEKVIGKKAKLKVLPMQPGDVQRTYADITKAQKILGYQPTTAFEDGIKQFIQWYKEVNNIALINV